MLCLEWTEGLCCKDPALLAGHSKQQCSWWGSRKGQRARGRLGMAHAGDEGATALRWPAWLAVLCCAAPTCLTTLGREVVFFPQPSVWRAASMGLGIGSEAPLSCPSPHLNLPCPPLILHLRLPSPRFQLGHLHWPGHFADHHPRHLDLHEKNCGLQASVCRREA